MTSCAISVFAFLLIVAVAAQIASATLSTIYPCPPFGLSRLPHSTACDKYIQCFAGKSVERDCGPGLAYDEKSEECLPQDLAQCHRNQCPLFNDPAKLVYLPDYLDCEKYYLCYNNEPQVYRCAEGLHWDEEREYCTSPAEAECTDYEIVCNAQGAHNVPNPRFCNQYYFCLSGQSFPATCPGDLLFDTTTNNCNYARDAVCYDGSIIP